MWSSMIVVAASFSFSVFASSSSGAEKRYEWETFRSDFGYEVQHPTCWTVKIDDPDAEGTLSKIGQIYIVDEKCRTDRRDSDVPNGVSIHFQGKSSLNEDFEAAKRDADFQLSKSERYLATKILDVKGGGKAVMAVELYNSAVPKIRWEMQLICPDNKIRVSGGHWAKPPKELFEKFKKGKLEIPEPEKKIFESIRCTKAKL